MNCLIVSKWRPHHVVQRKEKSRKQSKRFENDELKIPWRKK